VGDGRRQERAVAATGERRAISGRRSAGCHTPRPGRRRRARREDAQVPPMRDDESGDGMVLRKLRRGAGRDVAYADAFSLSLFTSAARRDFCRAALFLWMSPLRAARSRTLAARAYAAAAASAVAAARTCFSAVRSDERWARLRMVRVRAWRIAFFADLIFGMARKVDGKLRRVKRIHIFGRHLPEHTPSPSISSSGLQSCSFRWWPTNTPTPRQPTGRVIPRRTCSAG